MPSDDLLRFCLGSSMKYQHQLNLLLDKPRDATPQEVQDWQEKELKWWGDRQLHIVTIAVIVQISALGFMALVMSLNQMAFS